MVTKEQEIKRIIDKEMEKLRKKCLNNVESGIKLMRKDIYNKYGIKLKEKNQNDNCN